jgi:hypothetical protein
VRVVNQIAQYGKAPDLVARVATFTENLVRAVKKPEPPHPAPRLRQ